MMSFRHALACAPLIGAASIAATPRAAQGRPPVAAQIDQLQQQIQALQPQLQDLQTQVNASQKAPSAAAPSAAPPPAAAFESAPRVTQSRTHRFGIEDPHEQ